MKLRRVPLLVWKEKLEGISETSFVWERRGRRKCPGRVWLRNADGKPGAMALGSSSWWLLENSGPPFLTQSPFFTITSLQHLSGQLKSTLTRRISELVQSSPPTQSPYSSNFEMQSVPFQGVSLIHQTPLPILKWLSE